MSPAQFNAVRKFIPMLGLLLAIAALVSCRSTVTPSAHQAGKSSNRMERIVIAPDSRGFVFAKSATPFHPWGFNYGNAGRLLEDFWDTEWATLVSDFAEMKALGANVVRVHLQFGKFMDAPNKPNSAALNQLDRLLQLAERNALYLDLTGLACYRTADVPAWYDSLDEHSRWEAQANFWRAVAARCASSPAIFCYDLINEPLSPAQRREPGQWYSGKPFGGYDFLQYIALDPAGRKREDIARNWIEQMTRAVRERDPSRLITVGMLPWVQGWGHLSGFVPTNVASQVDFLSVHIYPATDKPAEAREALRQCAGSKPVVVEETFQLSCSLAELEGFLRGSRDIACGWMGHYDGLPVPALETLELEKRMTIPQAMMRDWLRLFVRLKPELCSTQRGWENNQE
jgi:hypothetical protein